MKKDVQRITFNGSQWWEWIEICDVCHNQSNHKEFVISSSICGVDLCHECQKKANDNSLSETDIADTFEVLIFDNNLSRLGGIFEHAKSNLVRVTAFTNLNGSFLKPGMLYIGKRNTGWQISRSLKVEDHIVHSHPSCLIYSYDDHECRVVKDVAF